MNKHQTIRCNLSITFHCLSNPQGISSWFIGNNCITSEGFYNLNPIIVNRTQWQSGGHFRSENQLQLFERVASTAAQHRPAVIHSIRTDKTILCCCRARSDSVLSVGCLYLACGKYSFNPDIANDILWDFCPRALLLSCESFFLSSTLSKATKQRKYARWFPTLILSGWTGNEPQVRFAECLMGRRKCDSIHTWLQMNSTRRWWTIK